MLQMWPFHTDCENFRTYSSAARHLISLSDFCSAVLYIYEYLHTEVVG